ncbi:MAG: hypothetical protein JWP12_2774 [Bacteroidetes bacterium]|nr:hypothetical protein [Bacteroidota bacterium]
MKGQKKGSCNETGKDVMKGLKNVTTVNLLNTNGYQFTNLCVIAIPKISPHKAQKKT